MRKISRFSLREKAFIIRTASDHRFSPIIRPTAQALLGITFLLLASSGHAQSNGQARLCPSPTFVYTPGSAVVQSSDDLDGPVEALADSVVSEKSKLMAH